METYHSYYQQITNKRCDCENFAFPIKAYNFGDVNQT